MNSMKKRALKIISLTLAAFLLLESPLQTYAEQSYSVSVPESDAENTESAGETGTAAGFGENGSVGGDAASGTEEAGAAGGDAASGTEEAGAAGGDAASGTEEPGTAGGDTASGTEEEETAGGEDTAEEADGPGAENLSAPVLTIDQQAPDRVLLRWTAVENAQEYFIYKDDELLCTAPASEEPELSYEDTAVTLGEKCTYRIQASADMGEQTCTSEAFAALAWDMDLRIPSIAVHSEVAGELALSWERAEGADGYLIYRVEDDGSYPELDTEELNSTFTGLDSGRVYQYAVWPYRASETQGRIFAPDPASALSPTKLDKVTLTAETVSYKMIKLTWNKCEGATGYRIYRKNENGEFVLLKMIRSGDTLEYKDTGLMFNFAYEYEISPVLQADGAVYEGERSEPVSARTILGIPGIGTVTCLNYETLEITWRPVAGAAGYEVYRAEAEDGAYHLLGRVPAGAAAYFQNKGVTVEKTYYYKVRAYRLSGGKKIYGEFSEAAGGSTRLAQVTGLKAAAVSYSAIKLTWDKVGAQKYQIYYSTEADSGYRYLASVAGSSYQFNNVICGQVYYFKVRAVCMADGRLVCGEDSSVVSQKTTIKTPSAKITQRKYNRITVQWGAVAGAERYELYFSESKNGEYEKISTLSGTSYTHTGLTLGRVYYYKVRAVRQKCITDFSNVVSGATQLDVLAGLRVSRSGSNNVVSWNSVEGVTSYVVSRSDSQNGGYVALGTVSGNSYTDTSASKYKTYYYKVQGFLNGVGTNVAGPVRIEGLASKFYGIDVSAYQGDINWKKVANDGIDFAMIRIITGTSSTSTVKDTKFETNYSGARKNGIKVGVYRYSYATNTSAAKNEARAVVSALNGRALDYPIVMDVEDSRILNGTSSNAERSRIILAFKKVVEEAGYDFALYANLNWLNNYLDMSQLSDVDIWIARWRSESKGHGYTGRGNVTMWQYTDSGSVDGISGRVDLDISYKNY